MLRNRYGKDVGAVVASDNAEAVFKPIQTKFIRVELPPLMKSGYFTMDWNGFFRMILFRRRQ